MADKPDLTLVEGGKSENEESQDTKKKDGWSSFKIMPSSLKIPPERKHMIVDCPNCGAEMYKIKERTETVYEMQTSTGWYNPVIALTVHKQYCGHCGFRIDNGEGRSLSHTLCRLRHEAYLKSPVEERETFGKKPKPKT
jgi:hypothetical protein